MGIQITGVEDYNNKLKIREESIDKLQNIEASTNNASAEDENKKILNLGLKLNDKEMLLEQEKKLKAKAFDAQKKAMRLINLGIIDIWNIIRMSPETRS